MNKDSTTITESGQQTINKIEYSADGSVKQFKLAPQVRKKQRKTKAERDTLRTVSRYQSQDDKSIFQPQSEVELNFFEKKRKVLNKKQELLNRSIFSNRPKGTSSTFTKPFRKEDNTEEQNDVITNIQPKKNQPEQGYVHQLKRNAASKCKSEAQGHIADQKLKRLLFERANKTCDQIKHIKEGVNCHENEVAQNDGDKNDEHVNVETSARKLVPKCLPSKNRNYDNVTPVKNSPYIKKHEPNKFHKILCCKSKYTPVLYVIIALFITIFSLACYYGLTYFNPSLKRHYSHHNHRYHGSNYHHHSVNKTLTRNAFSRLVNEYNRLTHQNVKIPYESITKTSLENKFLKMANVDNNLKRNFTTLALRDHTEFEKNISTTTTLPTESTLKTTLTVTTISTTSTSTTKPFSTTILTTLKLLPAQFYQSATMTSNNADLQRYYATPKTQLNSQVPYWTGSQWVWTTQNAYKRQNIPTVLNGMSGSPQQTSLNPMSLNFDDSSNEVANSPEPVNTIPALGTYDSLLQNIELHKPLTDTTQSLLKNDDTGFFSRPSQMFLKDENRPSINYDGFVRKVPTVIHDDLTDYSPTYRNNDAKPIHEEDDTTLPPSKKYDKENFDDDENDNEFPRHRHLKRHRHRHHRRKKLHRHLRHKKHHRRRLYRKRKTTTTNKTTTKITETPTKKPSTTAMTTTIAKTTTTRQKTTTRATTTLVSSTTTKISTTKVVKPQKLHWDERHHRFQNDDQLSKIFNQGKNKMEENPTRRKHIHQVHRKNRRLKRLRKKHFYDSLNDGYSGYDDSEPDGQLNYNFHKRHGNRKHHSSLPIFISGDGEEFAYDIFSTARDSRNKFNEETHMKPHHLKHHNFESSDGLDNYMDAIKSGHHFIDSSLKTIFEDAAEEFYMKNKKHNTQPKMFEHSHNKSSSASVSQNRSDSNPTNIENKDQNVYLKMITDLKKEIEEVKNKTKVNPQTTPVTTTTKLTTQKKTTSTLPTLTHTSPSPVHHLHPSRSIKRKRKQHNNLLTLLRAKIRKLRREKENRKHERNQHKVTKTYKIKSCVVIKKFKPSIKIKIISGPDILSDNRLAYVVKACKRKRKTICRNIHYKISTGRLLVKKQKFGGSNIYMIIGCKNSRDISDDLETDELATLDEGSAIDEVPISNEKNVAKRRYVSKHHKHQHIKKKKKQHRHKSHSHKSKHSHHDKHKSHRKPTRKHEKEKTTVKTQMKSLLSIIKDMRSEIKKQSGHKINEKTLVAKMKKLFEQKLKHAKGKKKTSSEVKDNKSIKVLESTANKNNKEVSKNLNSENLMFTDDGNNPDMTTKSNVEKPNEIYDDLFDNHQNKLIKNDEIRGKTIEEGFKNTDDGANEMFGSHGKISKDGVKNVDMSDQEEELDQLSFDGKQPKTNEEVATDKPFGEIGSSYKTVGKKQNNGGFDYPLEIMSKRPEFFSRKHDKKLHFDPTEDTTKRMHFMYKNISNDGEDNERDIMDKSIEDDENSPFNDMRLKQENKAMDQDETRLYNDGDDNYTWVNKKKKPIRRKKHHHKNTHRKHHRHRHHSLKTLHRRGKHHKHHKHHSHDDDDNDDTSGDDNEDEHDIDKKHSHKRRHKKRHHNDDDDTDDDVSHRHKKRHHTKHKKRHKNNTKHKSKKSRKKVKHSHKSKENDDNDEESGNNEDRTFNHRKNKSPKTNKKIDSSKNQDIAVHNNDSNDASNDSKVSSKSDEIENMIARIIPAVVKSVQIQNNDGLEKRSHIPTARPSLTPTKLHYHTTLHHTTARPKRSTPAKHTQHHTTRRATHTAIKQHKTTQANLNMIIKGLKALGIDTIQNKNKRGPTKRPSKAMTSVKPPPPKFHLHDSTKMRILCFGDSLTAGYNAHGKNFFPYCSRLQDILNYRSSIPVYTDTKGVVGEMTHKQMTSRLPLVLGNASSPYDWVIILGGTNDILHVKNFADDQEFLNQLETVWQPRITKDIEKLHQIANKAGARTMLLTVPENSIEAWPEYKPLLKMRQRINDALRKYALQSNGRTVLCDIANKLPRHSLGPTQEARLWDDHLHMTPEGYTKMAGTVADCMRPFLQHPNGW